MLLQEYLSRKKSKSFLCWAFLSCVQDELYQSARIPINLTAAPYQPGPPSNLPPPPLKNLWLCLCWLGSYLFWEISFSVFSKNWQKMKRWKYSTIINQREVKNSTKSTYIKILFIVINNAKCWSTQKFAINKIPEILSYILL